MAWYENKEAKEEVVKLRTSGLTFKKIVDRIKEKFDIKIQDTNLCVWCKQNNIAPLKGFHSTEDLTSADLKTLEKGKDLLRRELKKLERIISENQETADPNQLKQYQILLSDYKQILSQTGEFDKEATVEVWYQELKEMVLELFSLMPSTARYISNRLMGKSKEEATRLFKEVK